MEQSKRGIVNVIEKQSDNGRLLLFSLVHGKTFYKADINLVKEGYLLENLTVGYSILFTFEGDTVKSVQRVEAVLKTAWKTIKSYRSHCITYGDLELEERRRSGSKLLSSS
jgi:hypothetical protein